MRRIVSCFIVVSLVLTATSASALTQEEILKRRLEKMRQADSSIRQEEQQRQEHMQEATSGVESGPSRQASETLSIPDPVRQPHPEPKTGLFAGKPQPAATAQTPPASQPVAAPKPATPAAPAMATPAPQPMAPPAPQPAVAPAPQPMATPASSPAAGNRDPKAAASLAALAAKAQAAGDTKTALTMLDEAIAADSQDPDLRNNRGNLLSNSGKPREALPDYDKAIAAKASDASYFTNRGLAYERLGNRERACADYKKACDLGDCDFFKSYKAEGNCR